MPIELRHRAYFAYLDVPKDVRKRLRRRVYRQTLKTDSRSVAQRRAAPLIAQWKSAIAKAREEPNHNDARYWRDALRRATDDKQRAAIMEQIDMMAWDIGATNVENVGDRPSGDPEAQRFYAEATGAEIPTDEYIDEWIGSLQVKEKTARMRRATVMRLGERFPMLRDISRKEVRRWVTDLIAEVKPATAQRMMTDCRTYWARSGACLAQHGVPVGYHRQRRRIDEAEWVKGITFDLLPFSGLVQKLLIESGIVCHQYRSLTTLMFHRLAHTAKHVRECFVFRYRVSIRIRRIDAGHLQ